MNRTKNATKNIISGFFNKIIMLFFPFIIRTILIKYLGSEYLGLGSLFTSILQVLNLTELGFSSAIVFSLYKPIAEKDNKTICALLNFYKNVYRILGLIILIIGLALIPFLKYLIKGTYPSDINITLLYLIYLGNTVISYFLFAYRSTILIANQKNNIITSISTFINIVMYIFQILFIILFKNFYLYALLLFVCTILNNIICALYSKKMYPEFYPIGKIDLDMKHSIKQKVYGLMIQRICSTTRNSLDSIFISAFLGLNWVTLYTNYYTIISAFFGVMSIFSSSITAGIGNSIVLETKKKNYNDMIKFNFLYMIITGFITVCLFNLYQPFMKIWMGKDYLLNFSFVILFCIYFYALEMGVIRGAYSDAKGLWYENRYRSIFESVANIVLNFILVKFIGLYGIIIGTLISLLVINFGYGSQILYKYYFTEERVSDYFIKHLKYFCVTALCILITYVICSLITFNNLIFLFIKGIICVIITLIIYVLIYKNSKEFKLSIEFIKKILK